MKISLIYTSTDNDVISDEGSVDWHTPADLRRFRQITMGHTVVMGRKTYEKIGKPLEGRKNILLTRQSGYEAEGCTVVQTTKKAIDAADDEELFIMGGAEIYKAFEGLADKVYRTRVHVLADGKTTFKLNEHGWLLVEYERHKASDENPYDFAYMTYQK